MSRRNTFPIMLSLLFILATLLGACAPTPTPQASAPTQPPAPTQAPVASGEIILATTTSTQDTGLLDVLVPAFTQKTGITVKTVAVGTGQALKMGQDGNADVLLVHAPASEKTFMEGGYGIERKLVMHNDFIIVGPTADPAGIKGTASAVDAFKKIAAASAPFISRGDDSGTNKAELALWKKTEISPTVQTWYEETGQGMGATLKVASEKSAYTLTDRGTYLANKSSLGLDILVEGDNALLNIYHVIVINPEKWPKVNVEGARAFSGFILSPEIQDLIGKFGVDKYGAPLFYPDATKTDADFGLK